MNTIDNALWKEEILPLDPEDSLYRWVGELNENFLRRLSTDNRLLFDTIEYIRDLKDVPYSVLYTIFAHEISKWITPASQGELEFRYFDTFGDF